MEKEAGLVEQDRKKGNRGLIVFIILLSTFAPLSTDMYLPALPAIAKGFDTSAALVNVTLIVFFITFAVVSLVWGPLSDRFGRKIILIIGLLIYPAGSICCALSVNAPWLIFARIVQAIGGGVTLTTSTAITRDVYVGRKQETVLALVQSIATIGPIVAPVIGAMLLALTSWRGIFWLQAAMGVAILIWSFVFHETIGARNDISILKTFVRLGVIMKNPKFSVLLPVFTLVLVGCMAFVSSSTYIFQEFFGLSGRVYSYFFALNAAGIMLGPLLYVRLTRWFERNAIIKTCFVGMAASGLFVMLFGMRGPWIFILLLLPGSVMSSAIRPAGAFVMLAQQKQDIGAASSLLTCSGFVLGSVGMVIASLSPFNLILTVGALYLIVAAVSGVIWFMVEKNYRDTGL
ncbi:MAG: MFS transporter [Clostridiales Family XIII bacterium]|jgi:DHA1 family bicyclomycin/chloramphenicol resistance-like MFS transporter|nr:MFS transporter [Clostridiales Family XIII bacterium]